jgi:peptide deformylase
MKLVEYNDPILTKVCNVFDFSNPPFDPIEFSHELVKFMYDNNGLGLAANQVGVPYSVFAMRGNPDNFVCFNPKVISYSENYVSLEEGCLSRKGLIVKVKRPDSIRVRFNTPNGDVRTETFLGITARVFQHEMDHMNGELYFNKASRYHRDVAMRKWRD